MNAWQNAKLARETRTQQRLADSYLEVLRIIEREGQWVEANITNWKLAAEEIEAESNPDRRNWLPEFKRVKVTNRHCCVEEKWSELTAVTPDPSAVPRGVRCNLLVDRWTLAFAFKVQGARL